MGKKKKKQKQQDEYHYNKSLLQLTLNPQVFAVIESATEHQETWAWLDNEYWYMRFMSEVGELSASMAGDHEHDIEHEITQLGAICINWLRNIARLKRTGP